MSSQIQRKSRRINSRVFIVVLFIAASMPITGMVWPFRSMFGWGLYVFLYAFVSLVSLGMVDPVRGSTVTSEVTMAE